MKLIEWNRPCTASFGELHLNPGVNDVDPKAWADLADAGYKRTIEELEKDGDLIVYKDKAEVTVKMVRNTFNMDLLEDWLLTAKTKALRTAIKEQIDELDLSKKAS